MCLKISKVAIYGRVIHEEFYPYFKQMLRDLNERGVCLTCYRPFYDFLKERCDVSEVFQTFYEEDVDKDADVLLSVGGDGTFLDSAMRVKNYGVPVLGINSGRLGFLANIAQEEIPQAIHWLCTGKFDVEQRALVKFEMKDNPFAKFNYALNEISILKTERSSLLKVHAYI
ncbi:MAG TPA: NAD(+)/NADH kinase, partial [Candidatus Butyricimonas faecavium]|nr:NAD(+)/NADH kinase [Candidatus Butyricimonas faecavium]